MQTIHRLVSSALLLAAAVSSQAAEIFPFRSSGWKYVLGTQEASTPTDAWRAPGFDTSSWLPAGTTASAPVGYPSTPGSADLEGSIQTILPSSTVGLYTNVFLRKTFTVTGANALVGLNLQVQHDDGFVAWINGIEVGRVGVNDPLTIFSTATDHEVTVGEAALTPAAGVLVEGENTLAIQLVNVNGTSSDIFIDAQLTSGVDAAPTVLSVDPLPGSILQGLSFINIIFSENVSGVDAGDLLINGVGANSVSQNSPRDYTFNFPAPPTGSVAVAWAAVPNINDTDGLPTPFVPGAGWNYTVDPNIIASSVVISEFLADNANGISDEDGNRSDWLELFNPSLVDVNLNGWYLTDTSTNLTKWPLPNLVLGAGKYLRIWASEKDRRAPGAPLHTNFKLSKNVGSYLALVGPALNVVSVFTGPTYPAQFADVSYGRDRVDPNLTGYFVVPTPGAQNSTSGPGFVGTPTISHESGVYTNASLSVSVTVPSGTTVRYTLNGAEPTNGSPVYTAPLTVSDSTQLKVRAFPTSGNLLPSSVIGRSFIMLDSSARDFNSNLPILVINTTGQAIPQNLPPGRPRARGMFVAVDTFRGRAALRDATDYIGFGGFEIVGQTSAGFPKQPLRVELQDELGNDRNASLLGLPSESDWNLRNPYNDKTLMNDFLGYELWEDMGHYSCRRRYVEVFLDVNGGKTTYPGDYYGVMVLFERIERGDKRVDIAELTPSHTNEPAITGGYMFKKDKDSDGDINFTTAGGAGHSGQGLKLHEPKVQSMRLTPSGVMTSFPGAGYTAAATNQLTYLRNYLNAFEASMYAAGWTNATGTNHYSNYIDVDTFVDQQIHVEFTKQIDGYRLSSYYSKDRGGKVKPNPIWDWNLAFGNANYLKGGMTNGWYWADEAEGMNSSTHIWLRRLVFGAATGASANMPSGTGSGDPEFRQKITDRWEVIRTNVINDARLLERITELETYLTEAAARNWTKYPGVLNTYQWPNPEGGTFHVDYTQPTSTLIIAEMKKWVKGRYLWMDAQFLRKPALSLPGGDVAPGTTVSISSLLGTIYYTTDGTDPRLPGGGISPTAQAYTGPIAINSNARIVARAYQNNINYWTPWSAAESATYVVQTPRLVVTEIMYHPVAGLFNGTNTESEFEYVELKNVGGTALNVNGFTISKGIDFTFPNRVLAPGEYVVVVKNAAAFNSRYPGLSAAVAGEYAGNLANEGNRLVLKGRLQEPILDFSYNDTWYPITDGFGFSLVIRNPNADRSTWGLAESWRASGSLNGSPGNDDAAAPSIPRVVINEALTHSDPAPPYDTIELRNLSASEANIGGWYLTDDFRNPKKFRIPNGVTIPAGGYITFDETAFNVASPLPGNSSFGLSSSGDDEVYVFSGDGAGNLTGYHHGFEFGAALNGVTFGRHVTGTGAEAFVSLTSATLGSANTPILVGPVVISEIMYHPRDVLANSAYWDNDEDEFIELRNITGASVTLQHGTVPTNAWKLDKGVEFSFPQNTTIAAGGYLLVVGFNPVTNPAQLAAFRAKYNVGVGVQILGPYKGQLDNSGETVALYRPDNPETTGNNAGKVPYVLVDQVKYSDNAPWPIAADGSGHSLQRIDVAAYGDDVLNWAAGAPTAAAPYVSGSGPTVSTQPVSQAVLRGNNATFTVAGSGVGPLTYQWRFNGDLIGGGSGASLTLNSVRANQAGDYQCLVMNPYGAVLSSVATLSVLIPAEILVQPQSQTNRVVINGIPGTNIFFTNFTFSVLASSSSAITYQWQFNGVDIPGATAPSYFLPIITNSNEGFYRVRVTDALGSIYSQDAYLKVLTRAYVVNPAGPMQITAVAGENIVLGAETAGTFPIGYRWRKMTPGGTSVAITRVLNSNTDYFTVTNVSLSLTGSWALILSNVVWTNFNTPLTNAIITVLTDSNGNGLPDVWESAYFGSPTGADRDADSDGDGMKNWEEYTAGTNPTDASSYLRVESIAPTGGARVSFNAVAGKSYTVEYRDGIDAGVWSRLGDVVPRNVNWTATLTDPTPTTNRYYRIATPKRP